MRIPEEVIRATIRNNQKCFVLRDLAPDAKLVNKFILVSNIEAEDGGKAIVAGNERVIRARLSDAKFFYETDLKTPLEDRLPKFKNIVFHEKLGTQWERIERIERLAENRRQRPRPATQPGSERRRGACSGDSQTSGGRAPADGLDGGKPEERAHRGAHPAGRGREEHKEIGFNFAFVLREESPSRFPGLTAT